MQVWIYQMRSNGQRLGATALARLRPSSGWMVYRRSTRHQARGKSWEVHLFRSADEAAISTAASSITPLYFARLVHADGVLHIAGYEDHGRPQIKASPWYRPQSWLVATDAKTARAYLQRAIEHMPPDIDEDERDARSDAYIAWLMDEGAKPYR